MYRTTPTNSVCCDLDSSSWNFPSADPTPFPSSFPFSIAASAPPSEYSTARPGMPKPRNAHVSEMERIASPGPAALRRQSVSLAESRTGRKALKRPSATPVCARFWWPVTLAFGRCSAIVLQPSVRGDEEVYAPRQGIFCRFAWPFPAHPRIGDPPGAIAKSCPCAATG